MKKKFKSIITRVQVSLIFSVEPKIFKNIFLNSITKFFSLTFSPCARKKKRKKFYTQKKILYGIGKNKNDEIISTFQRIDWTLEEK